MGCFSNIHLQTEAQLLSLLPTLLCCSATDALKGEGLQEGVDWLQGRSQVKGVSDSVSV